MARLSLLPRLVSLTGLFALGACAEAAEPPPGEGADTVVFGGGGTAGLPPTGAGGEPRCGAEFPCTPPPGSGGMPTAAGGAPTYGGAQASGGAAGSPSALVCADQSVCTIELCPGASIVNLPLDTFQPCEMVGCSQAHCVPSAAVPAEVPIELLGKCADPTTVCIPDDYTATFGKFLAKECASIGGAEGRCISTCVPQVNGLMDALPSDGCGANERCAPCIHPVDGSVTGACEQGCDPGPLPETVSAPHRFKECQSDGVCVPKAIVPKALLSHLVQYECDTADEVCAPRKKVMNLKYNFPACTPVGFSDLGLPNPDGQRGGCVPAWLADANPFEAIFMGQGTCGAGEKCAPCHNPLRPDPTDPTGQTATAACAIPLPTDPSGGLPADTSAPAPVGAGGSVGAGGATSTPIGAGGAAPTFP